MAIETLEVRMTGESSDFTKDLDKAQGKFGKFKDVVSGMAMGVGIAVAGMAIEAGKALIQFGADSVGAASDLNETLSKSEVLFGDNAKSVQKWADNAALAFGQSKQQALDAAATFATFGKAAGLTGQDLESFATDFVGLSSDLASFNNTTPEQAIQAIGAALRGESEPLRAYGVLLDDASMRQKALELGIIDNIKNALTPQQKVLAAQALIYEQTSAAQGDFARTSDGLANQQRILDAQMENLKATIGQALLPVVLAFTSALNGLAQKVLPMLSPMIDAVGATFDKFFSSLDSGFTISGALTNALFSAFGSNDITIAINELINTVQNLWRAIGLIFGQGRTYEDDPDWLRSVKDFAPVIENVMGSIRQWVESVIPVISKLFGDLGATLNTFIDKNLNFLRAWFDQNMPRIQQIVSTVLGAIAKFWEEHGANIVDSIQRYFGWIMDFWSLVFRTLLNVVQVFLQLLTGDWEGAGETLQSIVRDLQVSLTRIFSQMIDAIVDIWTSIDWGGIGRAIMEGIGAGLSNARGWLLDQARGIAESVMQPFDWVWNFGSPSKTAADKIGRPIMEGIGVGMDKALGGVTRSMDAMLGGMVAGLSVPEPAMAGASVSITQQFYGQVDGPTVRQASQDGVLAALRATGAR